eukprot:TRINITY_DN575_c0_g2_i1.p1 TRINITY_DN575_c0_g2~~TRINITY_DN575_c0_g2_i1.p1  ORF type:complete len:201 (+),score=48.87 TRINITY_DN575_c0_g2_i1:51-605(+)
MASCMMRRCVARTAQLATFTARRSMGSLATDAFGPGRKAAGAIIIGGVSVGLFSLPSMQRDVGSLSPAELGWLSSDLDQGGHAVRALEASLELGLEPGAGGFTSKAEELRWLFADLDSSCCGRVSATRLREELSKRGLQPSEKLMARLEEVEAERGQLSLDDFASACDELPMPGKDPFFVPAFY